MYLAMYPVGGIISEYNKPYEWGKYDCLSLWKALAKDEGSKVPAVVNKLILMEYAQAVAYAIRNYGSIEAAYRFELKPRWWWRLHMGNYAALRSGVKLDTSKYGCALVFVDEHMMEFTYANSGLEVLK